MVFWLGEKLLTSFFTLWSPLRASPRVTLLTWKPAAAADVAAAEVLAAAGAVAAAAAVPVAAGAAAVVLGAGFAAVLAGAGAVLGAAGWLGLCCSFLPQALSASRPAKVMLQRAAERAENVMGGLPGKVKQ
jgi:hypothetical protein